MAIYSRVELAPVWEMFRGPRQFIGESVSFDSTPGRNVSSRPKTGVPAGKLWLLQSLYAYNGEDTEADATLLLIDDSGTDHARFGPDGLDTTPVPLPAHRELSWTGELWVPATWRVGIRFEDMTGGSRCHWRYTAVEI